MATSSRLPIATLDAALDEMASVDPVYLSTTEKQAALKELSRVEARVQAARLRVLAAADDIAETNGARSTAVWLADQTREAHGTVRRHAALAEALDARWTRVGEALSTGSVNLAQARVVAEALDALPKDVGDDLRLKAETYLVEQAATLGPRELKVLGRGVLQHLIPEVADEVEYQRLLAEEARARAATKLFFRPRGDGSTDLSARIPTAVANRLRAYLDAYTAPPPARPCGRV